MKRRALCFLLAALMLLGMLPTTILSANAAEPMKISDDGIDFIKLFEGFRSHAYYDNGHYSIGYGTSCDKNEYPNGITEEKAEELMREDLVEREKAVNNFAEKYKLNLTQGQFDALMSFTYNCGVQWMTVDGRFRQSVIDGDTGNEFVYNMALWSIDGAAPGHGLLKRRLCEADMYLNGYYTTNKIPREDFNYVILDAEGGTLGDRMQGYISGGEVLIKPVPVRTGYSFLGWYTEEGAWVTSLDKSHNTKTLYAHWQAGEGKVDAQGNVLGETAKYSFYADACVNMNKYAKPNEASTIKGTMKGTDILSIVADYVDDCGIKWGKLSTGEWVILGSPVPDQGVSSGKAVEVTVTNAYINVRLHAGVDSKQVGKVYKGDKLTIVRTQYVKDELWGKSAIGWVCLKYTDYSLVLENESNTDAPVIATGIVVVNDYLRIRQGAGTNYAEIGKLLPGDEVKITAIRKVGLADWARIEQGWVCMDYIQITEAEAPGESETPDESEKPGESETPDESEKPGESETPDESEDMTGVLYTGVVVKTNSLRIRIAPGIKNQQVGTLNGGQRVKILEEREVDKALWGRIAEGWISLDYIMRDPSAADKENAVYGVVTSFSLLNVRSAPGAHNPRVDTLVPGTVIPIYAQVKSGDVYWGRTDTGWVSMAYVQIDENIDPDAPIVPPTPDTPTTPDEPADTSTEVNYTGSVIGTYDLRVRTGPGTEYKEVTRLTYGVKVTITKITRNGKLLWGKIDNGWVCLTYIELEPTPENVKQPVEGTVVSNIPLHIRKAPGVNQELVELASKGDILIIYEITMLKDVPWGRTDLGWVCMNYVEMKVPEPGVLPSIPGVPENPGDTTETPKPEVPENGPIVDTNLTGKVIQTNALRIRKEAGAHNAEVGRLTLGTKVVITQLTSLKGVKWGKIDKGWICLDYVELDATVANAVAPLPGTVTVTNTKLNIRSAAGANNKQVGVLPNGQKITIYEITMVGKTPWGRMDMGWVCLDYVVLGAPDPAAIGGGTPSTPDTTEPSETEKPNETEPKETEPEQTPIDPDAKAVYTGKVYNTASLKVYKAAGNTGTLIETLKRDAAVKIYKIAIVGEEQWGCTEKGWINLAYVRMDATEENVAHAPLSGTVTVGNTPLRIREEAKVQSTQLGTLANGTKIEITKITIVNKVAWGLMDKGWVCLDYVILQAPDFSKLEQEPEIPEDTESQECQHTYGEWVETKAASCSQEGEKTKTCSLCNDVQTEKVPVIEHTLSDYSSDATQHWQACGKCTHTTQKQDHAFDNGVCTVCGYTSTSTAS